MPGITVWPLRSITRTPAGTTALAAGPTDTILPLSIRIVWSSSGALPVPSTTRTCCSATRVSGTLMTACTAGGKELTFCAVMTTGMATAAITRASLFMDVLLLWIHFEHHSHASLDVLSDMAVQHPLAGVRQLEQDVGGKAGRHEHRIFPHQVLIRHAIHRRDGEALAVNVNRMLHGVQRAAVVDQTQLDDVADAEAPADVHVFAGGAALPQNPSRRLARRHPVHFGHRPAPFDGVTVHRLE